MSFDGMPMTESVACLMHIGDLYPEAALAPAPGTPDRGRFYRWLVYLGNPVQSTFYGFIYPGRSAPPEAHDAVKAHAIGSLDAHRTTFDTYLRSNGPYLLGDQFSSADLFLFMLTRWGRRLERRWWDAPALAEHYLKIKNRPAMKRVFDQEELHDEI